MTDIIREFMMDVMDRYDTEKSIEPTKSTLAGNIKNGFPQKLREAVFPGDLSYSVRGWAGAVTWAVNPFVLIRRRDAGYLVKNALSIMYVFSADMKSCYLALMVPWERFGVDGIAVETRMNRNHLRAYNGALTSEVMDLGSGSDLAIRMEEACVFCRPYKRDNMPDEMMLQSDLANTIMTYENYIGVAKFGKPVLRVKDGSIDRVYIKYRLGSGNAHCHCEAIHADTDSFTQHIVEGICRRSGSSGIINTASSHKYDLNRPANPRNMEAVYEYRDTIHRILQHKEILDSNDKVTVPYLHIAFHAIKNGDTHGSEIRVSYTEPASYSIVNWFCNKIKDKTKDISVHGGSPVRVSMQSVDKKSKQFLRYGEDSQRYNGNNKAYHFILVEISEDLRCMSREILVKAFSEVVRDFSSEFGRNKPGTWHERNIG